MTQLNRLIERLCDADVEYVVVGGFAGMLHGSAILTPYLDICAAPSPDNLRMLRDTLRDLTPSQRNPTARWSLLDDRESNASTATLRLETTLGPLRICCAIEGVGDYARVRRDSIEIELFGRSCHVSSIEDLIRANETSAGPADCLAAMELRAILELTSSR